MKNGRTETHKTLQKATTIAAHNMHSYSVTCSTIDGLESTDLEVSGSRSTLTSWRGDSSPSIFTGTVQSFPFTASWRADPVSSVWCYNVMCMGLTAKNLLSHTQLHVHTECRIGVYMTMSYNHVLYYCITQHHTNVVAVLTTLGTKYGSVAILHQATLATLHDCIKTIKISLSISQCVYIVWPLPCFSQRSLELECD